MNAMPTIGLSLFGLIVIGALVAIILLLAHRKTRAAAIVVVGVLGFVALLLLSFLLLARTATHVSRPASRVAVKGDSPIFVDTKIGTVLPLPPAVKPPTPAPADAAVKREEELSQAVATKTVGFLRAMMQALGRALAEEEKNLAAKKATTQSLPSPGTDRRLVGRGAGGEGGSATDKPALTLTLSQGERGPNTTTTRPAWVDSPPQLVGDAYQMNIVVGPYTTRAECDAKLPDALQEAFGHYVDVCLGDQATDGIRLPDDYLRQQLVKAEWEETRQYSVGLMTRLHVLLQFDRKVKDRVLEEHRQAIVAQRLQLVGAWAAMGLALLAVLFGYLKTDLATGGAYRGRLRWATAIVILGLLGVVIVVVS